MLTTLEKAAYGLANEIWEGQWSHVPEVNDKPISEWIEMPRELATRCPGFSPDEYSRAMWKAMIHFK